jgi:two-component system, NarL family, sensor histidine kinase DegS
VTSVDEDDQRLLAAAHAAMREAQRKVHSLSEEARLQYQQQQTELERCRQSLEELANALGSRPTVAKQGPRQATESVDRAGMLGDEALLREKHRELSESAYRMQRTMRLLGTTIRRLEGESSRLQYGRNGFSETQEEELRSDSNERVIQAHEQERLRLAREIHDGPAQILANAIFELEYFERLVEHNPSALKEQLQQLKRDLRDGMTEVRRFIFDLRPPSLADSGFLIALRGYLQDFEKHFGISVEMELPQTGRRLPATQEMALFRIVQEALQNVQKHAAASKVVVTGEMDPVVLRLSIVDNGRGFDLTEVASRHSRNLGLISMRERAELIDARLQITTAPGQGTRISLVVPLEPSAE